jgi:hypothetical protein
MHHGNAMSRMHFQAAAESIGAIKTRSAREREIERWIPMMKRQNKRFNEERFRAAVEKAAGTQQPAAAAAYARRRFGNALFGRRVGPQYDPHRPWILQEYRSGGGVPKSIRKFESQAAAAAALRYEIAGWQDELHRHVFRVRHVTGAWSMRRVADEHMTVPAYYRLRDIQLEAWQHWARTAARRGHAARSRTRR